MTTKRKDIGSAHLTDVGGLNSMFVGMPEGMYHAPDAVDRQTLFRLRALHR